MQSVTKVLVINYIVNIVIPPPKWPVLCRVGR